MSKANSNKAVAEHPAKKKPTGDYPVGYCKPDPKHQFQPGNHANPKGRPKGSRNRKVLVDEIFLEQIPVREGNSVKMMSKIEAVLTQTINDALKGDHKARLAAISIAREEGLLTPEQEEALEENLSETDKKIMDNFMKRNGLPQSAPETNGTIRVERAPAGQNSAATDSALKKPAK